MTSEKLVCLFIFLLTFFEGNYFLKSKEIEVTETGLNKTKVQLDNETFLAGGSPSRSTESSSKITLAPQEQTTGISEFNTTGINSTNVQQSEVVEIFHEVPENTNRTDGITVNSITIKDCINTNSTNTTCTEPSWSDSGKTNYTLVAEAAEALNSEDSSVEVEKVTAIAAGVFLVSAVIGYLGCVGYRRFLQRKYGNSTILTAEEVYDTTDLRYFEI